MTTQHAQTNLHEPTHLPVIYYCAPEWVRDIVMHVHVCVCVSVCLAARISRKLHVLTSPNFLCLWPWLGYLLAAS